MDRWVPHERDTWLFRYAKLTRDVGSLKAGTLVKIVMVSRLGDIGITTDLSKEYGYELRVGFDDVEPVK